MAINYIMAAIFGHWEWLQTLLLIYIYIQRVINQHGMESKPQIVSSNCLNH